MDHQPTVWPIEWAELLEFCNSAGYRMRLEPRGSLLIPPDYNVSALQPALAARPGFSAAAAGPCFLLACAGATLAALPPCSPCCRHQLHSTGAGSSWGGSCWREARAQQHMIRHPSRPCLTALPRPRPRPRSPRWA